MFHTALNIGLILLGVYVVLSSLMFFFQSRLVYFPTRAIERTPEEAGLTYERISFRAGDGVALSGWFIPAEEPRGVVLFSHGNAGNISHRIESILIFNTLGLSTFIYDYRGYGESKGSISEEGTYRDVMAAWSFLVNEKQVPASDIILFGRSLGGAVGAWLAQKVRPKCLIVESSFTSIPDVAADHYPFFPVRLLSRFHYRTIDYVQKARCPVLVVHSPHDEIVPYEHGLKIYEAAREPKEFLQIHGGHNEGFILSSPRYEQELGKFITIASNHAAEANRRAVP